MKYFLATLIYIVIASLVTGFFAEMGEHIREKATGNREYSIKQNFGYATIVYTTVAIIVWGFILASKLLS